MPYTSSSTATTTSSNPAPHSKNAALRNRSESPYQQRTTQKDNPTQQLIKQAVDFLLQQLEARKSETLTAYLAAMARFHAYSFGNILAIARQRPSATRIAGFYAWKELGRFVKRGEKGIQILAPMVGQRRRKDDADQSSRQDDNAKPAPVLIGFRAVYVFESQTEGAPLPELEAITGEAGVYLDRLREYISAQGIALEYDESIAPALGAAFGNTIRLLPGQADAETFTTLAHELAHLMLKHGERRTAITKTVRETEAEAVAFVVAQGIGLKSEQSSSYIQLYHGNAALLMESLEAVQQTSAVILAAITAEKSVSQEVAEPAAEAAPEHKRERRSRTQTVTTEAA
jgi:hypothetical protein